MEIQPCTALPRAALEPLVTESAAEGFRFLRRLVAEYEAGRVCFDQPGERLLIVYADGELIALGGVTVDPYAGDPGTGRIRHVYVRRAFRRRGVGRQLIAALEAHARAHFTTLVLRTDTEAAARFYETLGYERLPPGGTATHRRSEFSVPHLGEAAI